MERSIELLARCRSLVALTVLVMLGACGGGGGGGGGGGSGSNANFFPLNVGDHWVFRTQFGQLQKVRVTGTTASALGTAFVVETGPPGATTLVEQRFVASGGTLVQVPTAGDDPLTQAVGPVTLLRYPVVEGDTFQQVNLTVDSGIDADGDGRTDALTLRSDVTVVGFESVSTAAGTFNGCAHVRTLVTVTLTASSNGAQVSATTTGDDWYAPDVGPVRSQAVIRSGGSVVDSSTIELFAFHVGNRRNETVAPTIASANPAPGSTSRVSGGITIDFSEVLDADTDVPANMTLFDAAGVVVPTTLYISGTQVTMIPSVSGATLTNGTYRLQLESGLADLAGNPLAAQSWTFVADDSSPSIVSAEPAADARNVRLDTTVRIAFSEDIAPATAGAIRLTDRLSNAVPVTVAVAGNVVTLTPAAPLQRQSRYTVVVDSWLTDLQGNPMNAVRAWDFYTDPGLLSDPVNLLVGSSAGAVAIGDVNGDGRPDVVTTTTYNFDAANDFKLFVFLQQPDGTLAPPVKLDTAAVYGCFAESIAIADIDGDGRNDVILGEAGCGIEIFHQGGNGTLASTGVIATAESYKLRAVDFDADGRADLVSMGWGTSQVAVWRQLPGGALAAPVLVPIEHFGWGDIDVGDINGDGRPDIVVTSGQGDHDKALAWVLQQPDGSFGTPQYRAVDPTWGAWGVAIGDVNGDGRDDVVASWGGNSPTFLGVFYQQGDGTLAPMQTVPSYDIPGGIEIADMNNDGRKDIVVIHRGWNAVSVHLQRADGTLAPRELFQAPYVNHNTQVIAVGDVNSDGYADIAVAGLSVLYNRTPALLASASAAARQPALPQWQRWRPGLSRGAVNASPAMH